MNEGIVTVETDELVVERMMSMVGSNIGGDGAEWRRGENKAMGRGMVVRDSRVGKDAVIRVHVCAARQSFIWYTSRNNLAEKKDGTVNAGKLLGQGYGG